MPPPSNAVIENEIDMSTVGSPCSACGHTKVDDTECKNCEKPRLAEAVESKSVTAVSIARKAMYSVNIMGKSGSYKLSPLAFRSQWKQRRDIAHCVYAIGLCGQSNKSAPPAASAEMKHDDDYEESTELKRHEKVQAVVESGSAPHLSTSKALIFGYQSDGTKYLSLPESGNYRCCCICIHTALCN